MEDVLKLFGEETAVWFKEALGEPTQVQREAWPAIAAGGHVLVSAPTGTGTHIPARKLWSCWIKLQWQKRKEKGP